MLTAACVSLSLPARASSALSVLAPELAHALGAIPASARVVASPLVSDVPSAKGDELVAKIAFLLAGHIAGGASASAHGEPLSTARAQAAKAGALVYVRIEIARGRLRATADVYPVLSNGWDRARVPAPAPRTHAFASAPIDAEVRAFLPPLSLEQLTVHKASHSLGEVLAVACGDLDGDGANELVLVTRAKIAWGKVLSGAFVATRTAPWDALARRVPVPLREPLGTAAIVARRDGSGSDLFAGLSDRGGISLSRDLLGASRLLGLPVPSANALECAKLNPPTSSFEGPLFDCATGKRLEGDVPAPRYDAIAVTERISKNGDASRVVVAREPTGTLHLRAADASATLEGVGAAVALGDLDEDGTLEVATTAPSGEDAIAVSSWDGRTRTPRARIAAPAGVSALSTCPPDDGGVRALVAVVGSEVWIVR